MKKAFAASLVAAVLAAGTLAGVALAADQVQEGRTIEAFTGTDLVDVQGYPANRAVTIDVLRNGVLVGSVSGTTDGEGFTEFNHVGGGQVSEGGDCFEPNATPDIKAGDVIRTRTAGDAAGVFDSAVVRDTGIDFDSIVTNTTTNTITISGHVRSRPDAVVVPGTDVLELRLNKGNTANTWETGPGLDQDRPGRRDLRVDIGAKVQPNGTWTRVLRVSRDDALDWKANPGEVALEWSEGAGANEEASPPAIFVADEAGGEAIVGCPAVAEYGVKKASHKAINKSFVNSTNNPNLVLTGASFNAERVVVRLNNRVPVDAVISSRASGHQTWRATFTNARVNSLPDGNLTAAATYTVNENVRGAAVDPTNFRGEHLTILKDTVAPTRAPTATPEPGTYNRALSVSLKSQARTEIHYQFDRSPLTLADREFVRPIRVTGTQTIRAAAFDRAGNKGPQGSFRYRIR